MFFKHLVRQVSVTFDFLDTDNHGLQQQRRFSHRPTLVLSDINIEGQERGDEFSRGLFGGL